MLSTTIFICHQQSQTIEDTSQFGDGSQTGIKTRLMLAINQVQHTLYCTTLTGKLLAHNTLQFCNFKTVILSPMKITSSRFVVDILILKMIE